MLPDTVILEAEWFTTEIKSERHGTTMYPVYKEITVSGTLQIRYKAIALIFNPIIEDTKSSSHI